MLDRPEAAGWDAEYAVTIQGMLSDLNDRLHTILHDRVGLAEQARALSPQEPERKLGPRAVASYLAMEAVLDALNRLEVRGRDSVGISIWIQLNEADRGGLIDPISAREDPLLRDGSVVLTSTGACFIYKHAAIIGKLGDNVAALRQAIRDDVDLHALLRMPSAAITILAHTRWASVGRISEANAHPVDSRNDKGEDRGPFTVAVINGDIDNYLELSARVAYSPSEEGISTDSKVLPALLSERLIQAADPGQALCTCVEDIAGSLALGALADGSDEILLAVKGSGQSLYVGLDETGFIVASEVYGLVANTKKYFRVDGTSWPGATRRGTILALSRHGSGTLGAVRRWDGDGVPHPVQPGEVRVAEITTRDLALGSASHYLQKEIREAPSSFRKTLRGRVRDGSAGPVVSLPEACLPSDARRRIRTRELRDLVVIGQGTAAVAGQGIAQLIRAMVGDRLAVSALPASEFSAWQLRPDMSGTCIVAVSQSGTTTDTNRTVDLAKERGATVLSVVNRRDSDLATKSHGVIYTSDGRDVEMSVASTKAFYAQVAAGCLLGVELGRELGVLPGEREANIVSGLQRIPGQLVALAAREQQFADAAEQVATRYPSWAVVGSGPNRVSAAEIRIKLSELCYKTISTDAVEDKKHIDLSAEALVLVCAAGALPNQLSDLVKEVEILTAHGNKPVVLCDEGTEEIWPTELRIALPAGHPDLMWIITTAAGHLFAYHAARCIDAAADPLRLALARLEHAVDGGLSSPASLPRDALIPIVTVLDQAGQGRLRGIMTSQTAMELSRLALLPRKGEYAPEMFLYEQDPSLSLARTVLTRAIEELGRPIDSVKHQAKTVTVGTSRDDADLYDNHVIMAMEGAGVEVHMLSLTTLRIVRAHARVIDHVTGVTRYRVSSGEFGDTIQVVRKTGCAAALASRADHGSLLVGSKRRVAELRTARLLRGRSDGRLVLTVTELHAGQVSYIAVVHVTLRSRCHVDDLVAAMDSVGDRAAEIVAAVTETVPSFTLDRLRDLPTGEVLLAPVESIAERLAARD